MRDFCCFFFFKQKTAYEMRISDWSSDVCSSDLRLSDAPYFAGDEFTTADIIMAFPLTTMRLFVPRDISAYPNLKAYLAKIVERPAFKRALKVGDPGLKRSEEHTSELQSLMRISYAVFCLKTKKIQ